MNATQLHTPYLLDQDWLDAIEEALAKPATVPFAIEPEVMAVYSVMHGQPCAPELWYRTVKDCEIFIVAYKAATAAWADKVSEVNATAASGYTDLEYAEMTDEYASWMQDVEFIRGGC